MNDLEINQMINEKRTNGKVFTNDLYYNNPFFNVRILLCNCIY